MNNYFQVVMFDNCFQDGVILHKAYDRAGIDQWLEENPLTEQDKQHEARLEVQPIFPVFTMYYQPGTVGCYGKDADGNSWSTFSFEGGHEACDYCGKQIKGGYMNHANDKVYCVDHVAYVPAPSEQAPPRSKPLYRDYSVEWRKQRNCTWSEVTLDGKLYRAEIYKVHRHGGFSGELSKWNCPYTLKIWVDGQIASVSVGALESLAQAHFEEMLQPVG